MPSPFLPCAEAVRDLINGETWDETFTATAERFPKYKNETRNSLVVVVTPALGDENAILPDDRGSFTVEVPILVLVTVAVDRLDTDRAGQMEDFLYGIAKLVAESRLADYGRPVEEVAYAWDEEEWRENGVFFGRVGMTYEYEQARE